MSKKRKRERELTPYQQELAEYRAYREQAYWRTTMARLGVSIPWVDPTVEYQESEED